MNRSIPQRIVRGPVLDGSDIEAEMKACKCPLCGARMSKDRYDQMKREDRCLK